MSALLAQATLLSVPRAPALASTTHMKIQLSLDDLELQVRMEDHATARDFISLLPLHLSLEDYAAIEKIATLPRRLPTAGAPAGYTPEAGDLAYYAPWGNLALFYKGFSYSAGLIRLGRIEGPLEALAKSRSRTARWRLAGG
ncbi:cyclophilin-like fold protein [Curvibacter sp. HBC61]|uniref:Cyclophilin-like fold protein n=1 Tax=Curvibacter cyanobacteriorum TaxID=3026422 RepID=A0ABT5N0S4_9BURK|nr:cyclophilin-like fold protein [Curvibacter sp. HBC61]